MGHCLLFASISMAQEGHSFFSFIALRSQISGIVQKSTLQTREVILIFRGFQNLTPYCAQPGGKVVHYFLMIFLSYGNGGSIFISPCRCYQSEQTRRKTKICSLRGIETKMPVWNVCYHVEGSFGIPYVRRNCSHDRKI